MKRALFCLIITGLLLSGPGCGGGNRDSDHEPCVDGDGDGYGDPASPACTHPELDCDDTNADINPGVNEIGDGLCDDGIDQDCDGSDCHLGDVYVNDDGQYVYIGNTHLELVFDRSDGKLYGIQDKATEIDFLVEKNADWSLFDFWYSEDDQIVIGFYADSFRYETRTLADGMALDLTWDTFSVNKRSLDVIVEITINVKEDSPLSYWTIDITNNDNITINKVDFPAIHGLEHISNDPDQDYLVFSSMTGLLFQNPFDNFKWNKAWGWDTYPSGAYSTMQFLAYYGLDPAAGLYIAAYDNQAHTKYYEFRKIVELGPFTSWLHTKIQHIPEFVAGADYQMDYSVAVGVFSGDWYDASQIYRSWASEQPWVSQGDLWSRSDIPEWYPTAGVRQWILTHQNCNPLLTPFEKVPEIIEDTANYLGSPAIASWFGWEREAFYSGYPDVFPPKEGWDSFRQVMDDTHAEGNRMLFLPNSTSYSNLADSWNSAEPWAAQDHSGTLMEPFSISECDIDFMLYKMCPSTDFWKDKLFRLPWEESLLRTLSLEGADEIQLDGFPIFGPRLCEAPGHGHPAGGGTWWYDNYHQIFSDFKTEARLTNPDLVMTTEGLCEAYLDLMDVFWDPFTTGWSPSVSTVASVIHDLSKVELVPLWHAVYHDYAFIESGTSFFSHNGYGDYRDFYIRGFGLALVWGEMPVTDYVGEKITELDEDEEIEMAVYLQRIVDARIGYAQPYLMYGRMLRPPDLDVPDFHILGADHLPYSGLSYPDFDSSAVLSSLWQAPDGDAGYIFTNISHDPVTFSLTVSSTETLLSSEASYTISQNRNGSQSILFEDIQLPQTLNIQIDPMDVLLIEIAP